jgi:hypothetical protein
MPISLPNNGMHPTADTNIVIYFQRCGAAGDAGRSTARPHHPLLRRFPGLAAGALPPGAQGYAFKPDLSELSAKLDETPRAAFAG